MALWRYLLLCWSVSVYITLVDCAPRITDYEKESFRREFVREMLSLMDERADPCTDIYQYACGNFENLYPIPAGQESSSFFRNLIEQVSVALRELIEDIPESREQGTYGSPKSKMKRFYDSCMDRDTLDLESEIPLVQLMEELGGRPFFQPSLVIMEDSIEEFFAATNGFYSHNIIRVGIISDYEYPDTTAVEIGHQILKPLSKHDLTLGYNSSSVNAIQYSYVSILELLGFTKGEASDYATRFIDFEMQLLAISPDPPKNQRDGFNKLRFGELIDMFPDFDWNEFLIKSIGRSPDLNEAIIVSSIDYFTKFFPLLMRTDQRFVRDWVLMKIAYDHASYLDQRFTDVRSKMLELLLGISTASPTWKNCVEAVRSNFPMLIGGMYAQKYFDEESRSLLQEVVEDIRQEFRLLIEDKEWLRQPTKRLALEKLEAIEVFIGYDDKVVSRDELEKEYRDYNIDRYKFFDNVVNIELLKRQKEIEKFGKPVEKEPACLPSDVNAGYDEHHNTLTFPAAYLQPPSFHKYYPRVFVYASIGAVIGHEFGHAFDAVGGQYNKHGGLLKNWWDEVSWAAFSKRAECFIEHYNQYTVHGLKVNGTISVGENSSDNSGLRASYLAYKKWLERNRYTDAGRDELLPGLNFDNFQVFFLKFAQMWCDNIRPETAYLNLQDPHPPGNVRVTGNLVNNLQFAEHFQCPIRSVCELW